MSAAPVHASAAAAPRRSTPRRRAARLALVAAGAVLAASATGVVHAATFGAADEAGYVLGADQTVDDNLFAAGQTVTIDGRVNGDLFAAGQDVVIHGTVTGNVFAGASVIVLAEGGHVNGDLFAGGQEIRVAGQLDGDLRGGGSVVHVIDGGRVGGEMMAGGYHVSVDKGGQVARGLYAGGTQAAVDGRVGGDANIGAGAVRLSGTIDGDAHLAIGGDTGGAPPAAFMSMMPFQSNVVIPPSLAAGLTLDPSAHVGGDLDVTAPARPTIPEGQVSGKQSYRVTPVQAATTTASKPTPTAFDWLMRWLRRTLAVLVLGALALWLAPRIVRAAAERLRSMPLPSFGWGALLVVASPVAAVVLIVAAIIVAIALNAVLLGPLVGPWLAAAAVALVLLTAGVYVLSWLGTVSVALTLGHLLVRRWRDGWREALAVGAPIVALLAIVPTVGGVARAAFMCFGIGALAIAWYRRAAPDLAAPLP